MTKLQRHKRDRRINTLRSNGYSFGNIGIIFGISRQRVQQITSGYKAIEKDTNYHKIKKLVLLRDNHSCQKCLSKQNVIVHHLDQNCCNNVLVNLISLCKVCHIAIHHPLYHRTKPLPPRRNYALNVYADKLSKDISK